VPRTRKTASGQNAQPIQAIPGQEYGRGVAQERMQAAMPTPAATPVAPPQTQTMPTAANPNPEPNPEASAQPQQQPSMDPAQLQAMLKGVGGLLRAPDDRPNVSFTQTLNDPSAALRLGTLPPTNRLGEMMRDLTRRTGDNTFADLAAKAGL